MTHFVKMELDFTLQDEPVENGMAPTMQQLGEQMKRLDSAQTLERWNLVDTAVIGARVLKLVEMASMVLGVGMQQNVIEAITQMLQTGQPLHQLLVVPLQQMQTRLNVLDARFDQMQTQFVALDARFDQMQVQFVALDARAHARGMNSSASELGTALMPVANLENEFPAYFPGSVGEFMGMSGQQVNTLSGFYSLPATGTVAVRKAALARYCGIKM